jgi:hypothetical protein
MKKVVTGESPKKDLVCFHLNINPLMKLRERGSSNRNQKVFSKRIFQLF